MAQCILCKDKALTISQGLPVCLKCLRERPDEALPIAREAHQKSRSAFQLPPDPPRYPEGIPCDLCVNECRIPENGSGYCGLRKNEKGTLRGVTPEEGKLSWYHDSLPTNCVADWVCPGGTGAGYPHFSLSSGPECGYKNLAVFFHACSFNCLYCQNWHFRKETRKLKTIPVDHLVANAEERTTCICYFGGDPTPQLPFSIEASQRALAQKKGKIFRICWETNGSMHRRLLDEMIVLALNSGGCIKFDLKAWDENLHIALTAISNRKTIENFARAGEKARLRPNVPLVVASTTIVPGYIDELEIRSIARFIARIDPEIPYSLLAYYPHFYLADLPFLSKDLAHGLLRAAQEEGLKKVRIGNSHLLK